MHIMTYLYLVIFPKRLITEYPSKNIIEMTLSADALEGFLVVMGVLIASYVVGEVVHLFNQKQNNETFQNAINEMTKSTISAVESIKDTTTLGVNALLNMDTLRDVNSLAQKKTEQHQNQQNQQTK